MYRQNYEESKDESEDTPYELPSLSHLYDAGFVLGRRWSPDQPRYHAPAMRWARSCAGVRRPTRSSRCTLSGECSGWSGRQQAA